MGLARNWLVERPACRMGTARLGALSLLRTAPLLGASLLLVGYGSAVAAGPPNDDCANPIVITEPPAVWVCSCDDSEHLTAQECQSQCDTTLWICPCDEFGHPSETTCNTHCLNLPDCEEMCALGPCDEPCESVIKPIIIEWSTIGATTDGTNPTDCPGMNVSMSRDIWFRYQADTAQQMTISLCDTPFLDTALAVYEVGSCPPTTAVACNDNACGAQSRLTFVTLPGQDYLIRIGGIGGKAGIGTMEITLVNLVACVTSENNCLQPAQETKEEIFPGCEDPVCCLLVCLIDPLCCENNWDQQCANLAALNCTVFACELDLTDATVEEAEACGDDANGGCDSKTPAFEQVTSDTVVHGTTWADDGARDTDWYQVIDFAAFDKDDDGKVDIHVNIIAESPMAMSLVLDEVGDCAKFTKEETATSQSCVQTGFATITVTGLDPKMKDPFVYIMAAPAQIDGNPILEGLPCPPGAGSLTNNYLLCITVVDDGVEVDLNCPLVVPCPWDLDGGGFVGVGDLLIMLANWNNPYGIGDLLDLLAAWGACP